MPFQNQPNGTRAKAHQVISGRPAAPQANSPRAKAHQIISGRAPRQQPNSTRAKAAQVMRNPVLDGANISEAIRIFVFVNHKSRTAFITYSKITLAQRGSNKIRTELSTTTAVSPDFRSELDIRPVEVITTGYSSSKEIFCESRSILRERANLDLAFFNEYVRKVKEYRDSSEFQNDLNQKHLPINQAAEFNERMTTATLAGSLPFGLANAPAAMASRLSPRTAALTRWTASRLSKLMNHQVGAAAVADIGLKSLGLSKSLDKLQGDWGANYADPRLRPICVYSDLRTGSISQYRRDVSPAWVKTAHSWLYQLVFGTLGRIL